MDKKVMLLMREFAHEKKYWMEKLSGEISTLSFPIDYQKSLKPEKKEYPLEFDSQMVSKLIQAGKDNQLAIFAILVTAFKVLLMKYTSQEDIVVASPMHVRDKDEYNEFVILRDTINPGMTFLDALMSVKTSLTGAYRNQHYPLNLILEELDYTHDSFTNVILILENIHKTQPIQQIIQSSLNHITLYLVNNDKGLTGRILYNASILKESSIKLLFDRFQIVCKWALSNLKKKLDGVNLLTDEEKEKVVRHFNRTETPFRMNTIHQEFIEQVLKNPHKIAIAYEDRQGGCHSFITYSQLDIKSQQLAERLKGKSISVGTIVPILLKRSIEMIIAYMAILKTGAAYLPVDPALPRKRIDYMLNDCAAGLLITTPQVEQDGQLENWNGETLFPDDSLTPISIDSESLAQPCDLAYVIYTSGSTGKPKGVLVEHKGVISLTRFHRKEFDIHPQDHIIQFASSAFDASVWEIYMALLNSATLLLIDENTIANHSAFHQYIEKNSITVATLPPEFAQHLNPGSMVSLRLMITAGSAPSLKFVDTWKRKLRYINAYGPTETTVCATYNPIPPAGSLDSVTIGKPIHNTELYIVDTRLKPQPIGIPGEILIGGIGIARGYLNNPRLTAQKFISNHISSLENRLYRSGDLGRWLPDGTIEFLGRIDQQVKIRGFRIELGEVENQLKEFLQIKDAVVVTNSSKDGDKQLCAYFIAHNDSDVITPEELKEYLAQHLPYYAVPAFYMQLEALPITISGKVDTKALPPPVLECAQQYRPPKGDIENAVCEIWADVLGIHKSTISRDSIFFDLGGYSLKGTLVVAGLQKIFNISLSVGEMFKKPTLKDTAKYVEESVKKEASFYSADNTVILLRKQNPQALNLFMVHDGTGDVEAYMELAEILKFPCNCYGIRMEKHDSLSPREITIQDIANHYIRKIKKIQPQGPYYTVGWSLGGAIAFQIANQMEAQGDEMGLLVLIDAPGPDMQQSRQLIPFSIKSELKFVQDFLPDDEFKNHLTSITDFNDFWPSIVSYLETHDVPESDKLKKTIAKFGGREARHYKKQTFRELIHALNITRSLAYARVFYLPQGKIDTPLHFIGATKSGGFTEIENWDRYCRNPHIFHKISGDHYSILKMPGVVVVAELFNRILTDSQKKIKT